MHPIPDPEQGPPIRPRCHCQPAHKPTSGQAPISDNPLKCRLRRSFLGGHEGEVVGMTRGKRGRKAQTKTFPSAPRNLNSLYQYSAFYSCFYDAIAKEAWAVAGDAHFGKVRAPAIPYVPQPCAKMFITHLASFLDLEVVVMKLATETIHAILIDTVADLQLMTKFQIINLDIGRDNVRLTPGNDLHAIMRLMVEWHEGHGPDGGSSLMFVISHMKVSRYGDVRLGTGLMISASDWKELVMGIKKTVRGWEEERVPILLRAWSRRITVEPVTVDRYVVDHSS